MSPNKALPALLVLLPLAATADRHLRYENIRDQEVTEIQQAVGKVEPGVMVNIGSVIEGCDCAEGLACSDQVRVVSQRADRPFVLRLSKISGHWALGPVETWERSAARLRMRRAEIIGPSDGPDYRKRSDEYWERVKQLNEIKPSCETAATTAPAR